MVLQVENNTYEAKTQEIAKQVLAATQENRSFLAALRDQMRWDDKLLDWAMFICWPFIFIWIRLSKFVKYSIISMFFIDKKLIPFYFNFS